MMLGSAMHDNNVMMKNNPMFVRYKKEIFADYNEKCIDPKSATGYFK